VKGLSVLFACALLLAGCSTQENTARKHLFWKASDSNSTIYLLGSLHFADSTFYPLDSVIENAFDRSEELAVEIDLSDDSISRQISLVSEQYGFFQDGQILDSVIPASISASLDSLCLAWTLPLGSFSRYRPMSAGMTVTAVGIMRLGYDSNLGIDVHFLKRARDAGKKIISLETVEEQAFVLTGGGDSDSLGIFYLETILRETPSLDSATRGMMRAWKTGDDSLFCVYMNLDTAQLSHTDSLLKKEINERIYYSRNRKMAESIATLLAKDRNVFVIVGAAHLAGNHENVIDILRAKGFTVEQL
jgi:uncharacterized protein YbaP (TraB family)